MKKNDGFLFEIILKEIDIDKEGRPTIDRWTNISDKAMLKFIKSTRLRAVHYMVLLRIAFHIDKNGWCHPNTDTIAGQLGMSRESVGTYIKQIEGKKFEGKPLLLVDRGTYGGKKKNTYTVPIAKLKYIPYDDVFEEENEDYEVVPVDQNEEVEELI